MDFRDEIIMILEQETKLPHQDILNLVVIPPDPKLGDYAFPCFKLGKNPVEEARKLKEKIKLPPFLAEIKVAGPYLNFFLKPSYVTKTILNTITKSKKKYGAGTESQNLVIEYCGPNTNKPLHLGHMRNMALGNAMHHILQFRGNKVHAVNIVNDRGIHICQSLLAYHKWGRRQKPDKKGDHFVGDYYVLFAKRLQEHPELKNETQDMLVRWEHNDPDVRKLWKTMTSWVLKGFARTYQRFGVSFEKEYFESGYYEQGRDVAFEGLQRGIFQKDDSKAIVARLESYQLPNKVVLRGDGTTVYITQDLYLTQLRYDDFKFDRMIYVVASEQQLHFKQLFKILELLQRPYARHLYHLSYGLVNLPSGRMKSREGTVVDADDLMDEVAALARKEVDARYPSLPEKEKARRAEFIGLGAIKFFLLRTDPVRDMIYDPQESLSFDGETGPYVQYTYARASSILRKAGKTKGKVNFSMLTNIKEQNLVKLLGIFPQKVEETSSHYKPHILCRYLLDVAQAFNELYHAVPVISEHADMMNARIVLVRSTQEVLGIGLGLLGIEAPEEM